MKGEGNQLDFGARVYDPRIGRFFSKDPLEANYPWQSTYVFAGNNPIKLVDVEGKGPGDNTKLYTNTTAAEQIANGGFNSSTYGKYSRYNWFSTAANQSNTGRANSGVTFGVEGIDVKSASIISKEQTSLWEAQALQDMGYTNETFTALKGKERSAVRSEVLGRMYSKVGEYLNANNKDVYFLERDGTYAVSDNYVNYHGRITEVSGPGATELLNKFSRPSLNGESAAALKAFGEANRTIKWGGRAMLAVAVAADVYEIYQSKDIYKTINKKVGGWSGAISAGAFGAEWGSVAGPWGTALGGVLFGAAGYIMGEETTSQVQDYIFSKGVNVK